MSQSAKLISQGSIPSYTSIYPLNDPHAVDREDRIKVAGYIASLVQLNNGSKEDQNGRMLEPNMYNYHLLLNERADYDELYKKYQALIKRTAELGKELTALKRAKM